MCNLSEGIERKGIEKGIEQGIKQGIEQGIEQGIKLKSVEGIYNLMTQTGFSMEKALDILGVQEADREEIARLVREKMR